ncbi:MAG: putative phage abortive infection protein [Bacteroidota bacterium]
MIFAIFIAFIIIILFLPYLISNCSLFSCFKIEFNEAKDIGDTINGIMGPFIAIAAAILTFIAFWVQYKANQHQRDDIQLERFENKFYELLRLHKENVNEVRKINKDGVVKEGRQLFNTMYRELEFCYKLILAVNEDENGYSNGRDKYFIEMAYNLFYFGVGQGAMNTLTEKYYNDFVAKDVIKRLKGGQENYYNNKTLHNAKLEIPIPNAQPLILHTDVPPFHGYIIGHYYRHLYQTVKYVEAQTFLGEKQKYSYIKIL